MNRMLCGKLSKIASLPSRAMMLQMMFPVEMPSPVVKPAIQPPLRALSITASMFGPGVIHASARTPDSVMRETRISELGNGLVFLG